MRKVKAKDYTITITHDPYPDLSWVESTPEEYAENPQFKDGVPIPYEEWKRTYGDPRKHVSFVITVTRVCRCGRACCRGADAAESVGGVDFMEWDNWQTGDFRMSDIEHWETIKDETDARREMARAVRELIAEIEAQDKARRKRKRS